MKFTDLFIKRPVLAAVVNLVILIAGLQSIRSLSVRQYPRSDIALVRVTTAYIGANAALTQVQAKVAQVRNDLPPEAEAPVIELETADNQFAAMYLGFSSDQLDQNQITDYLTRVVQPKLSAISGVQRAQTLSDRTFAMRVWLK